MGIRLGKIIYQSQPGVLWFDCPGCKCIHQVFIDDKHVDTDGRIIQWTWNGNADKPSFNPSVHVHKSDPRFVCHSWVKNGRIEFLMDSHHSLKGMTVDLPDWK